MGIDSLLNPCSSSSLFLPFLWKSSQIFHTFNRFRLKWRKIFRLKCFYLQNWITYQTSDENLFDRIGRKGRHTSIELHTHTHTENSGYVKRRGHKRKYLFWWLLTLERPTIEREMPSTHQSIDSFVLSQNSLFFSLYKTVI